jgi:hypothetical protein
MRGLLEKKRAEFTAVEIIIIVFILLVVLILTLSLFPEVREMFYFLNVLGGNTNNVLEIKGRCDLACSDINRTAFCFTQEEVKLGGGRRMVGNCSSFMRNEIAGFKVSSCSEVSCGNIGSAKCYEGNKKVECESWSVEDF